MAVGMVTPSRTLWDQRFLNTTRGRIVTLLRRKPGTVDELARTLDLTDNAIRAHLATLERDGLVRQEGLRRGPGSGKPASFYVLTAQVEALFPKAYGELLRQLLHLLSERLDASTIDALLEELAWRLAEGHRGSGSLEDRVAAAVGYLGELGGLADFEACDGGYRISSNSCPLAAIVPGNPAACRLAELLIGEVVGVPVQEHCTKDEPIRCHFDVAAH